MPRFMVYLTRSSEYTAIVEAKDVDEAKENAEALPLDRLTRAQDGSDNIEAWDARRLKGVPT